MKREMMKAEGRRLKCLAVALLFHITFFIATASAQSTNDVPPLLPALPEISPTVWENEASIVGLRIAGFVAWLLLTAWLLLKPCPPLVEPIEVVTRRELTKWRRCSNDEATLREIIRCFRRYLIVVFDLPTREHTTEEICCLIDDNPELGVGYGARVTDFLRRCDAAGFTGVGLLRRSEVATEALQLFELGEKRRAELRQVVQPR